MAKVAVNEESLVAIGDAIRDKRKVEDTYKLSEMPGAIASIVGETPFDLRSLCEGDLTALNIPSDLAGASILDLRNSAFADLVNCQQLTIGEGIRYINGGYGNYDIRCNPFYDLGGDTTNGCKVSFPSTLLSVGDNVFLGVNFSRDTFGEGSLPEGLHTIGKHTFSQFNMSSYPIIDEIHIPSSITKIGEYAFYGLDFRKVYFKGTPTSIGSHAFYRLSDLANPGQATIYVPWSQGSGPWLHYNTNNTTIVYDYKE